MLLAINSFADAAPLQLLVPDWVKENLGSRVSILEDGKEKVLTNLKIFFSEH